MQKRIEHLLERTLYASRWIMAPVYLAMSLVVSACFMGYPDKVSKH